MPVLETLSFWPTLPVVVEYGGSPASNPPVPEDEDNIVAALKQSDRVRSISLTVTKTLLEKLSTIWRPFSELEDLVLLCGEDVPLTLSSTVWCGARLRSLHLTRATIFALPQLLFLSMGLVDLQLHEISDVGYITPEAFASALSGMSHLRTLSLHFLSSAPYRDFAGFKLPPPNERVTLLSLKKLKYRGTREYLDGLAARIDAPRLGNIDIDITFFSQPPSFVLPQTYQFINRIAMQKSHRRADILFSENVVFISFTQSESPTCVELQVSCKSFSQQISHLAWICKCLYPLLPGIEHLRVCATRNQSGHDYMGNRLDRQEWQNLLWLFKDTKWAYIACGVSTDTIISLLRSRQRLKLFPALHKLCIPNPRWQEAKQEAVESLIHSRILSGHSIAVEYERLRINELHGNGTAFLQRQFLLLTNAL